MSKPPKTHRRTTERAKLARFRLRKRRNKRK